MEFGLSLRRVHDALNRLADGETVAVEFDEGDVSLIAARLKAVAVDAATVVLPSPGAAI